jgi:hypothetical protein
VTLATPFLDMVWRRALLVMGRAGVFSLSRSAAVRAVTFVPTLVTDFRRVIRWCAFSEPESKDDEELREWDTRPAARPEADECEREGRC